MAFSFISFALPLAAPFMIQSIMGKIDELREELSEYLPARVRVYRGEAFIGNNHIIIPVKGPGKANSLLLSGGQIQHGNRSVHAPLKFSHIF